MIVGVITDFEMTFTGDLFKIAWQNYIFAFKVSKPNKKMAMVLSKIQVTDQGLSLTSCLKENKIVNSRFLGI